MVREGNSSVALFRSELFLIFATSLEILVVLKTEKYTHVSVCVCMFVKT